MYKFARMRLGFGSKWQKGYDFGMGLASEVDYDVIQLCQILSLIAGKAHLPEIKKLSRKIRNEGEHFGDDFDEEKVNASAKKLIPRMRAIGDEGMLGFMAGALEEANLHNAAKWFYDLTEKLFPNDGAKQASDEIIRLAAMSWEECIEKAKKNPDVQDPEALCGWLKYHGPNAKKGEIDHDWQQGHSSLLHTRPDYGESYPDDGIIEEEEVEEWLDRDAVAEFCPSCADKMDEKGICRIKSSVIREAKKAAESNKIRSMDQLAEVLRDVANDLRILTDSRTAAQGDKWKKMPNGWTDKSRKKFWDSLTGDRKHKVTACIKKMTGKVDNPGGFCAALADRIKPGWRSEK